MSSHTDSLSFLALKDSKTLQHLDLGYRREFAEETHCNLIATVFQAQACK